MSTRPSDRLIHLHYVVPIHPFAHSLPRFEICIRTGKVGALLIVPASRAAALDCSGDYHSPLRTKEARYTSNGMSVENVPSTSCLDDFRYS